MLAHKQNITTHPQIGILKIYKYSKKKKKLVELKFTWVKFTNTICVLVHTSKTSTWEVVPGRSGPATAT